MIPREILSSLKRNLKQFPVVSLTGPRQSGKTTLLRTEFKDFGYVSLENPDSRSLAISDPKAFFSHYGSKLIIDEAQRVPELFSYMQGIVDESGQCGQYIVSGSQNFLLIKAISQSLAGRIAVRHLPPLSFIELKDANVSFKNVAEFVLKGGYPRIYDIDINPKEYFPSYIQTYIDRDIREELGVVKVTEFNRFVSLCAARVGNLVNISSLANECGINEKTAKEWLSLLEQSFITLMLHPYYKNYGKRVTKTPKLYFLDTGLLCSLLNISNEEDYLMSNLKGAIFENAVISELYKRDMAKGEFKKMYFWRDSSGREIDLLIEEGITLNKAIEIKSSSTYSPSWFKTLKSLGDTLGVPIDAREVIYSGTETIKTSNGILRALFD